MCLIDDYSLYPYLHFVKRPKLSVNYQEKSRRRNMQTLSEEGMCSSTNKMDNSALKIIHQFLMNHNFETTATMLAEEALKIGFASYEEYLDISNHTCLDPYERLFLSYKTGNWRKFFKLWNMLIPDDIKKSMEYKVMTLNLHVHFAILPKRMMLLHMDKNRKSETGSTSSAQDIAVLKETKRLMIELEKNMNENMAQLREYLNANGKELEHETQLRPFFALPFIEDPYAEPLLSKIFDPSWLDVLTRDLRNFVDTHRQVLSTESKTEPPAEDAWRNTSNDNVPIIPNDRDIPIFLETNETAEQCGSCQSTKHKLKSRGTQTYAHDIQLPLATMQDLVSNEEVRTADTLHRSENGRTMNPCNQELAIAKSHLSTIHSSYEKLKFRFHKLHADYHKLINVAGELTAALESSVKGQAVDLQAMLETCIEIFPDLFNRNIRENSQSSSRLQLEYTDVKSIAYPNLEAENIPPKLLDYRKVKLHLIKGNMKTKLYLLQALRWKITLGQPVERDDALHEYISSDLLGLHGQIASDNGKSILPYLLLPENIVMPHPLQQSTARLLNALASFRCGRDYLSAGSTVVAVVFACLNNKTENKVDAFTCNMMIAMLQKLSLRKQQRIYMIENGLVEWLIHHLHEECHSMDHYRQEYATALMMNLSLHRAAQARASAISSLLISTLLTLLSIDHMSSLPYINGALNNFLSNRLINDEARKMNLSAALEYYRQRKTGEIRKHLDHILKIHKRENTNNMEDEDATDDDNEQFDILENELEENDPVKNFTGELNGEALLATCYTISSNNCSEVNIISSATLLKPASCSNRVYKDQQQNLVIQNDRRSTPFNKHHLPRGSSKTTITSSIISASAGENRVVDAEKLSSIASLSFGNDNRKTIVNDSPWKQRSELDKEQEAFLAKPKISRTPP
ncbi:hypothetical protein KM043_003769 [Ampulex compressa]|nr:hypothetical protein KM043_003769 [Ampulex compressa]